MRSFQPAESVRERRHGVLDFCFELPRVAGAFRNVHSSRRAALGFVLAAQLVAGMPR
jgi:hypothetical protein